MRAFLKSKDQNIMTDKCAGHISFFITPYSEFYSYNVKIRDNMLL